MKELVRLLTLFRPYAGWMLLGMLLSLVTLLSNIALMAVSGWFIAAMALAGAAGVSMNYFSPAAIIRATAILRTAGRYAERLVTHEATFRLIAGLRVWFYQRLVPLASAGLDDLHSGDLMSRLRGDIDTLDQFYLRALVPAAVAVIAVILITVMMWQYDTVIAAAMLLMLLCAGLILPLMIARFGRLPGEQNVTQTAELKQLTVELVQGMAELTSNRALDDYRTRLATTSDALGAIQRAMGAVAALAQSGQMLFASLALWLVLLLAIPLLDTGKIEPAQLAMLALFALSAFEAVMPLPQAFRTLGQVWAAARRVFEVADREPVVKQADTPAPLPEHFDIAFRRVHFAYQAGREVLHDISFSLAQGQRIAIVGETGVGKSSLIPLLLHHREVTSGQVLLGGRDIGDYSDEQLHEWFAVVPQQVHLFNTTIRNNLLLAKLDATDEELDRVCRIACIDEFIARQPDGYDTWVGETGVKISGGQARRLTIARALLRDFHCLVLDEPGADLDRATERKLMVSLDAELGGRSMLLITHSAIGQKHVDQTMVLDNENILTGGFI